MVPFGDLINLQAVYLEQAVQIAPKFALAWYHLGNAQVSRGDKAAAIESFKVCNPVTTDIYKQKMPYPRLEGR